MTERAVEHGVLCLPEGRPRAAALVLSGSSGRVEASRARVLAEHGVAALAVRWFGDEGQPPTPTEVPVESIAEHVTTLREYADRIIVLGTSYGAAAAMLVGIADPRVDLVVAIAPTTVVWATPDQHDDGTPVHRSQFTWHGDPLHFVPYVDQTAWRGPDFTTTRQLHEASLRSHPGLVGRARIVVEDISADLLLVAGGDDRVWPSAVAAQEIRERRTGSGAGTRLLIHPRAGHRVLLPDEDIPPPPRMAHGGTPEADRELGAQVLEAIVDWL
ncbi:MULTISPECIES: alpha/beta fold hydrolase [unclassified Janibacter]|uniref:alpha/beta fold hydrolase n=1 Tax=unclassified Janibacter TaxID=2649294 RepID=UPI003CFCC3BB